MTELQSLKSFEQRLDRIEALVRGTQRWVPIDTLAAHLGKKKSTLYGKIGKLKVERLFILGIHYTETRFYNLPVVSALLIHGPDSQAYAKELAKFHAESKPAKRKAA